MLGIGADAYKTLTVVNKAGEAWDIIGVASTTATAAQTSTVATLFFAPKGWLALIGMGTASTPIGWVIAAGVAGGCAWWGITQYMKKATDVFHVDVIPEFINTPLDTLALGIFDLFAPIALKLAQVDGGISTSERDVIMKHFVKDWGYDEKFVSEGLSFAESRLSNQDVVKMQDLAHSISLLAAENPDCKYDQITKHVVDLLRKLVDADQESSETKEIVIEKIEKIFDKNDPTKLKNRTKRIWEKSAGKVTTAKGSLLKQIEKIKHIRGSA
jgi:hypothetical protein